MLPCTWALAVLATLASPEPAWQSLYDGARWADGATAWTGDGTVSKHTTDGLRVADPSTAKGSGRFYQLDWQADPARGAALEARVKVVACSAPWGVAMMVADGVHEEGLTLYPDRVHLEQADRTLAVDATAPHTYRLEIQGQDVRLAVDGKVAIDAAGRFTAPAQGTPPRNQCGFGCGASAATGEAVWSWVRFRSGRQPTPPPDLPDIPGLRITRGETIEIVPGASYAGLFRFRDGRLAVGPRRSADGGRTWQPGPALGPGALELDDGEVIAPGFSTHHVADGLFEVPLNRSLDGGRSFRTEQARLRIPQGTGGTGDDGKHYDGPSVDHAMAQARDGSLLMAMYGYFKTDTVLCPAYPPEWKLYKYRTWVMRSTDRGATWDYLATVAYDPAVGCESFCEPELIRRPNGDLLCFMRTGGSPPKWMTPLYLAVSQDDGRTWSKPAPIADRGVWPNACRMASGVLVLAYGRPDNWLQFSLDDGVTWAGRFCYDRSPGTAYASVEEVAAGRLLVVYDRRALNADGNPASSEVGTFFEVARRAR